jgi:hypothetical protein
MLDLLDMRHFGNRQGALLYLRFPSYQLSARLFSEVVKVVKSEDVQTRTDNSFLRLIYLASRHRPDGQYFDPDLAERTSYSECDALLRKEHIQCFLEYMSMPVKRQNTQMLP